MDNDLISLQFIIERFTYVVEKFWQRYLVQTNQDLILKPPSSKRYQKTENVI